MWSDVIGLAFSALSERKLRSALTILMVLIGATLMTSLNGMNGGFSNFINQQLNVLGANLLSVTPTPIFGRFGGGGEASPATLNAQTVKTLKALPGVADAVPFYTAGAKIVSSGISRDATVTGIDQGKLRIIYPKLSLEDGMLLQPTDSVGIILGNEVAHPPGLTAPFASVGQTVTLQFTSIEDTAQGQKTQTKTRVFQVKGVLNSIGSLGLDSETFITTSAANALFEKSGKFSGIYVLTKSPDLNDQVESSIKKIYGDNIGVISPKALATTIGQTLSGFTSFITGIAAISMLVGGVGIITTLYTSVMERTREIGLLKALGFRNEVVVLMFLMESAMIGLIGGSVGIIAGIGGAELIMRFLPLGGPSGASFPPVILPSDLATVFALSLGLSVLAGLYPAWRAASLDPIVALRKE